MSERMASIRVAPRPAPMRVGTPSRGIDRGPVASISRVSSGIGTSGEKFSSRELAQYKTSGPRLEIASGSSFSKAVFKEPEIGVRAPNRLGAYAAFGRRVAAETGKPSSRNSERTIASGSRFARLDANALQTLERRSSAAILQNALRQPGAVENSGRTPQVRNNSSREIRTLSNIRPFVIPHTFSQEASRGGRAGPLTPDGVRSLLAQQRPERNVLRLPDIQRREPVNPTTFAQEIQARPEMRDVSADNVVSLEAVRKRLAQVQEPSTSSQSETGPAAQILQFPANRRAEVVESVRGRKITGAAMQARLRRVEAQREMLRTPYVELSDQTAPEAGLVEMKKSRMTRGQQLLAQHRVEKTLQTREQEKKRMVDQWMERVKNNTTNSHPFKSSLDERAPLADTSAEVQALLGDKRVPYHVRILQQITKLKGQVYEIDPETKALLAAETKEEEKKKKKQSKLSFLKIWSYNPETQKHDRLSVQTDPKFLRAWELHFGLRTDNKVQTETTVASSADAIDESTTAKVTTRISEEQRVEASHIVQSRLSSLNKTSSQTEQVAINENVIHVVFPKTAEKEEETAGQGDQIYSIDDHAQKARIEIGSEAIKSSEFEQGYVDGHEVAMQMGNGTENTVISGILKSLGIVGNKAKNLLDGSYEALLYVISSMGITRKKDAQAMLEDGLIRFPAVKRGKGKQASYEQVRLVMNPQSRPETQQLAS